MSALRSYEHLQPDEADLRATIEARLDQVADTLPAGVMADVIDLLDRLDAPFDDLEPEDGDDGLDEDSEQPLHLSKVKP